MIVFWVALVKNLRIPSFTSAKHDSDRVFYKFDVEQLSFLEQL
jgi:hypothetical protein